MVKYFFALVKKNTYRDSKYLYLPKIRLKIQCMAQNFFKMSKILLNVF